MTHSKRLTTVATLVATTLLATAAVRAASDARQKKIEGIYREADAQRQKLGLNSAAVAKQYPTPEMTFSDPIKVAPGGKASIVVAGKFQPGTAFVFESDDIEILKEKISTTKYEADIAVRAGALPAEVYLTAYTPVSAKSMGVSAIEIVANYEWDLKLANGDRMVLKIGPRDPSQSHNTRVEWTRGGKPWVQTTGTVYANDEGLELDVSPNDSDDDEVPANFTEEQQAMLRDIEKCSKLAEAEQLSCITKIAQKQEKKQKEERDAKNAQRERKSGVLKVKLAGAKVTGTFTPSNEEKAVAVTGTSKFVP